MSESRPEKKKLTKAEAGKLGGLRTADTHDMARIAATGGQATLAKYGRAHFLRLSHKSHGRLQG